MTVNVIYFFILNSAFSLLVRRSHFAVYFKHRLLEGAAHRARGEGSVLRWRPLLVPEARGWGLMLR